jgi:hypothetical protein
MARGLRARGADKTPHLCGCRLFGGKHEWIVAVVVVVRAAAAAKQVGQARGADFLLARLAAEHFRQRREKGATSTATRYHAARLRVGTVTV